MSRILVNIRVNGQEHEIYADPSTTLLELLRGNLGLTGTKKGCGTGDCGACTVLMNGKAVNSCLVLAGDAHGTEITTIEGLAAGTELHPIQRSFVDHGAIQCGFCTPGMIMIAVDLLARNPTPTEEEIREAISGNLCRCTGYIKIIEAIMAVIEYDG